MFVWLTLPPAMDGARLLERAVREQLVAFVPGEAFFPDRAQRNHLRLSFSLATPAMIDEGMARLGAVIRAG